MKTRLNTLAVLSCVACLSAAVHAECEMGFATNAISVQSDSGQGNYDCEVLQSPDGLPLQDLSLNTDVTVTTTPVPGSATVNDTIAWDVTTFVDEDGVERGYPVYFVSTNNSGQGKRCNYLYDGTQDDGSGLGATAGDVNNVTICASETSVPVVPETTNIIDTVKDKCLTTVDFDDTSKDPLVQDVTVGFSSTVAGQTITVCGNTADSIGLGSGQVACTPPPYVQKLPVADIGTSPCIPAADGSLPLTCAPVDITGAPSAGPEYCWYYENRVCEAGSSSAYCEGRVNATFIPKTKKDSFDVQIDVFDGSTCFTTFFYGVAYYTCY